MILVIDDDAVIGACLSKIIQKCGKTAKWYNNAIEAMEIISSGKIPEMVFLDIFLTGPDGFTFLNEMSSYADTMNIPAVIVSEKDFSQYDLKDYGVVGFLDKNTMAPSQVQNYVQKFAKTEPKAIKSEQKIAKSVENSRKLAKKVPKIAKNSQKMIKTSEKLPKNPQKSSQK